MYDSAPAFKIESTKGIPNKSSINSIRRNRERVEALLTRPMHKTGTLKFDGDPSKRTQHSLTHEDTGNFANMSLMSTLRAGKAFATGDDKLHTTIENPPSFYENDMNKWKKKFEKAVSTRATHKRQIMSMDRRTILATNDNFVPRDADARLAEPKYTGGNIQPQKSEFKKV